MGTMLFGYYILGTPNTNITLKHVKEVDLVGNVRAVC